MFGDTLSSKHYSQAKFKRSRQHASPRSFLVVSPFCSAARTGSVCLEEHRWPAILQELQGVGCAQNQHKCVFVKGWKGIPKTRHNDYNLPRKNVPHVYYQKVASPIRTRDVLKRLKWFTPKKTNMEPKN